MTIKIICLNLKDKRKFDFETLKHLNKEQLHKENKHIIHIVFY